MPDTIQSADEVREIAQDVLRGRRRMRTPDNYPSLDGDDGDGCLDEMEARFRTLFCFATAITQGEYPHAADEDLAQGIRSLYMDWVRFRHDIVHHAREAAGQGWIQRCEGKGASDAA